MEWNGETFRLLFRECGFLLLTSPTLAVGCGCSSGSAGAQAAPRRTARRSRLASSIVQ